MNRTLRTSESFYEMMREKLAHRSGIGPWGPLFGIELVLDDELPEGSARLYDLDGELLTIFVLTSSGRVVVVNAA